MFTFLHSRYAGKITVLRRNSERAGRTIHLCIRLGHGNARPRLKPYSTTEQDATQKSQGASKFEIASIQSDSAKGPMHWKLLGDNTCAIAVSLRSYEKAGFGEAVKQNP